MKPAITATGFKQRRCDNPIVIQEEKPSIIPLVIGIGVGVLVLALLIVAILYVLAKKKRKKET